MGPLSVGAVVKVWSRSTESWMEAEITAVGLDTVDVQYELKGLVCAKTISHKSRHLRPLLASEALARRVDAVIPAFPASHAFSTRAAAPAAPIAQEGWLHWWYWQADRTWVPYRQEQVCRIEAAFAAGDANVSLDPHHSLVFKFSAAHGPPRPHQVLIADPLRHHTEARRMPAPADSRAWPPERTLRPVAFAELEALGRNGRVTAGPQLATLTASAGAGSSSVGSAGVPVASLTSAELRRRSSLGRAQQEESMRRVAEEQLRGCGPAGGWLLLLEPQQPLSPRAPSSTFVSPRGSTTSGAPTALALAGAATVADDRLSPRVSSGKRTESTQTPWSRLSPRSRLSERRSTATPPPPWLAQRGRSAVVVADQKATSEQFRPVATRRPNYSKLCAGWMQEGASPCCANTDSMVETVRRYMSGKSWLRQRVNSVLTMDDEQGLRELGGHIRQLKYCISRLGWSAVGGSAKRPPDQKRQASSATGGQWLYCPAALSEEQVQEMGRLRTFYLPSFVLASTRADVYKDGMQLAIDASEAVRLLDLRRVLDPENVAEEEQVLLTCYTLYHLRDVKHIMEDEDGNLDMRRILYLKVLGE